MLGAPCPLFDTKEIDKHNIVVSACRPWNRWLFLFYCTYFWTIYYCAEAESLYSDVVFQVNFQLVLLFYFSFNPILLILPSQNIVTKDQYIFQPVVKLSRHKRIMMSSRGFRSTLRHLLLQVTIVTDPHSSWSLKVPVNIKLRIIDLNEDMLRWGIFVGMIINIVTFGFN